MPIYVYDILDKKGKPTGKTVELVQSMKDDALTAHPDTGQSIRRAITAPAIAGKWSDIKGKGALSNKNLERLGFTKYERKGKGYMEKTAGKHGPAGLASE